MFVKYFLYFVVSTLCVIIPIEGKSRDHTFATNSNYDNPDRWSLHEIPCAGEKIVFDPTMAVSVFVQSNATITEIILPLNGEFIFGEGVIWGLSNDLSSCDGNAIHVVDYISSANSWMDTASWKTEQDNIPLLKQDLLDSEKIPCQYDNVFFNKDNSWIISIPDDVNMKSLSLWDKQYTTQSFDKYRKTYGGSYQFQGEDLVDVHGKNCNDPAGCVCINEVYYENNMNAICELNVCPFYSCTNPLFPVGHCCYICGAILSFSYDSTYTETSMGNLINQILGSGKYIGVHPVLTKIAPYMEAVTSLSTTKDYIQVTVTDESSGTNSGKNAKQFAQDLLNAVQTPSNNLGIKNTTLLLSGEGISQQAGLSSGSIVGIVIGVLLAITLVIVMLLFLFRSRQYKLPTYKNFSKNFGNLDNPLYDIDTAGVDDVALSGTAATPSITGLPANKSPGAMNIDFGITFGNPLYEEEDV